MTRKVSIIATTVAALVFAVQPTLADDQAAQNQDQSQSDLANEAAEAVNRADRSDRAEQSDRAIGQEDQFDQAEPAGATLDRDDAQPDAAAQDASQDDAEAAAARQPGQSDRPGQAARPGQPGQGQQNRAGQQPGRTGQGIQGARITPQEFVRKASVMNGYEVAAAELALQQAQDNPQVKEYAQKIRDDHQKANQRLQQIAQSANVQWPQQLSPVKQAKLQELRQKQGAEFQQDYLIGQIAGHVEAILIFQKASEQLQEQQLKTYAREQLPHLKQHLKQAQRAAGVGQAITAGFGEEAEHGEHGATPAGERQAPDAGAGQQLDRDSGTDTEIDAAGAGASGENVRDRSE